MNGENITSQFIADAVRFNDIAVGDDATVALLYSLGRALQREHDKEIARLKAQVGSRATALQTVGDTIMLRYDAATARPVWREVDRLTGIAELPPGVEATNGG